MAEIEYICNLGHALPDVSSTEPESCTEKIPLLCAHRRLERIFPRRAPRAKSEMALACQSCLLSYTTELQSFRVTVYVYALDKPAPSPPRSAKLSAETTSSGINAWKSSFPCNIFSPINACETACEFVFFFFLQPENEQVAFGAPLCIVLESLS